MGAHGNIFPNKEGFIPSFSLYPPQVLLDHKKDVILHAR